MEAQVKLNSETGRLRAVVLHRPGPEIEKMTPSTIHQALYSDLLGMEAAQKEYRQLEAVLGQVCTPYYIDDLLAEVLETSPEARAFLMEKIARPAHAARLDETLAVMSPEELAKAMVQGVAGTDFNPLYNLYFTRDIGVCFNSHAMPTHMATQVRSREILITDLIYRYHPVFTRNNSHLNPWGGVPACTRLEGGDFQVAAPNVFVIGQGARSNRNGVDAFISLKRRESDLFYVITQELPFEPESFIHLDMVFTFLSRTHCMAYKPLILDENHYATRLLKVENGVVHESLCANIFEALHSLGYDYKPIYCAGGDPMYQEREQWHSGANFFAFAPGKIMGYGRNNYTIEALSNAGFEVVDAWDVVSGKAKVKTEDESRPTVYTIESSELVRGGGGCRCMTMPVCREDL
ncbi:MAG: arginine deiminase family protein [Bacteroides sp.]|nr:arginine deiminase family protein [Bacteroides sp.]MCM1086209.1 arginine deiminase family protein [Bacteroides sp.]